VGSALLLALMMLSAREAMALSGVTNVVYLSDQDKLQGFSATYKDVGDVNAAEYCTQWVYDEVGNYYCVQTLYYENWVSVTAELYNPSGGLYYSAHSYDFISAVEEYLQQPSSYLANWRAHGIHYLEQDLYIGYYDATGFWIYVYAGTNVYLLGETQKLERPVPVCSVSSTQSAAINTALQWPAVEPWERAATMLCVAPNSVTAGYFNDSFGQFYTDLGPTNDPCATKVVDLDYRSGGVHKHPYFQTSAEYNRGNGCLNDKTFLTTAQLNQVNTLNQDFSPGDKSAFSGTGLPFYVRVPLGNAIKQLLNGATTGVWP
jgi:hypothetical protein